MNKKRRSELAEIQKSLSDAKALIETELDHFSSKLEESMSQLEDLKTQEEEALEALPENMRYAERGEQMEAAINAIDEAKEKLNEITGNITKLKDDMDEVDTKIEEAQS